MGIICAACGETKATDQFAQKYVDNYLSHGQNVSCTACRAEGKMPKAGTVRCNSHTLKVCSACTISKPAFSSYRKFKGTYSDRCKACEVVACVACKDMVNANLYTETQIQNFFSHGRSLLCASCENLGHTVHDIGKYECKDCKQLFGRRKFEATRIMNHNAGHSSGLICQDCREREKDIRKKLKMRGSWKCKCGKPIHAE